MIVVLRAVDFGYTFFQNLLLFGVLDTQPTFTSGLGNLTTMVHAHTDAYLLVDNDGNDNIDNDCLITIS